MSSEDKYTYANVRSRIAEKMRENARMVLSQGVDEQGMPRNVGQAPNVTALADGTTLEQPTMAEALFAATSTLGVNLEGLMDSRKFVEQLVAIDESDTASVSTLVSETLAANPHLAIAVPRMKPNRAQGSSAIPVPAKPKTMKEQLSDMLNRSSPVDRASRII